METIEKKRFAETHTLLALVYRQAGQKHDTDWLIRQTLGYARRALVLLNGAGRKRIVAW